MESLHNWLIGLGLSSEYAWIIIRAGSLILLLLVGIIVYFVAKTGVRRAFSVWVKRTKNTWDDLIFERKLVSRVAQIAPAIVIAIVAPILFQDDATALRLVDKGITVYVILIAVLLFDSLLNLGLDIYERTEVSKRLHLKGLFQAAKLVVILVAGIMVIAEIIGESPIVLFSGLGAMTAIILLIFKDTILGFVAGIQLTANNMVGPGDWIEMPQYGADGDVLDVNLTTVKVQNWDKTISTIPTYALIQNSFRNWKGMSESGGRRIKRQMQIDVETIKYLTDEVIAKFKNYRFLKDYLEARTEEIEGHNRMLDASANVRVDGRALTNIGTFRAYCEAYLRNHPKIHQGLTLLVRQLQPTERGLPIEIYCFTNDTNWANYEAIQADIFDHLFAVLPEFGLRAFQQPSGADISRLAPMERIKS
jgi:miniconductance mechanosensitive channel